ncbi:MAG: cell envelope integrity protein CreD [Alphaproteobacteria bacterium]|nr:cell envelope integrity protein CreD [Alphaproteobacteria bacterium]
MAAFVVFILVMLVTVGGPLLAFFALMRTGTLNAELDALRRRVDGESGLVPAPAPPSRETIPAAEDRPPRPAELPVSNRSEDMSQSSTAEAANAVPAGKRSERAESVGARLLKKGVAIVLLTALIVGALLATVLGLVQERQERATAVTAEIGQLWGGAQRLAGPVLAIPFAVVSTDQRGAREQGPVRMLYVLPQRLDVAADLRPERRKRGMFEAVVFAADARLSGSFAPVDVARHVKGEVVLFPEQAALVVGVSDLRGATHVPRAKVGAAEVAWRPGFDGLALVGAARLHLPLPSLDLAAPLDFDFRLAFNGSGRLTVLPLGAETSVAIRSPWPDPSFVGALPPAERTIDAAGFAATWRSSELGRGFPQQWPSGWSVHDKPDGIDQAAFGVALVEPVTDYRAVERSVKFSLLIVGVTFAVLWLFEALVGARVHLVQYGLVGAALALFFVLLLALAEQAGFARAYAASAAAVVGLSTAYAAAALRGWRRAAVLGGALGIAYGGLYVLLSAEDLALLAGSLGLLAILAAIMWLTRKLDWYALAPAAER